MKHFLAPFAAVVAILAVSACSSTDDSANTSGTGGGYGYDNNGSIGRNSLSQLQDEFRTQVGDHVYFQTDSTSLNGEARQTLDSQATFLQGHPSLSMTIEGHCDERGTREYNLGLGERRAQAIKDYLMAHGISGQRLSVVSYGKERPESLGSNPSAWAQNRRGISVLNQ